MVLNSSSHQLEAARELILKYRRGEIKDRTVSEDDLWRAKTLYSSAYHPDTGNQKFICVLF